MRRILDLGTGQHFGWKGWGERADWQRSFAHDCFTFDACEHGFSLGGGYMTASIITLLLTQFYRLLFFLPTFLLSHSVVAKTRHLCRTSEINKVHKNMDGDDQ